MRFTAANLAPLRLTTVSSDSFNAISIIPPYGVMPRKVIQIITATNPSIVDAVGQFDLDVSSSASVMYPIRSQTETLPF